jgi:hypothetical protein
MSQCQMPVVTGQSTFLELKRNMEGQSLSGLIAYMNLVMLSTPIKLNFYAKITDSAKLMPMP